RTLEMSSGASVLGIGSAGYPRAVGRWWAGAACPRAVHGPAFPPPFLCAPSTGRLAVGAVEMWVTRVGHGLDAFGRAGAGASLRVRAQPWFEGWLSAGLRALEAPWAGRRAGLVFGSGAVSAVWTGVATTSW